MLIPQRYLDAEQVDGEVRDADDPCRAAGYAGEVGGHDLDDLAEAEGDDGQVVAP